MNLEEVALKAEKYARDEVEKYGLPATTHLDISLEKGVELANKLNANVNIVKIGVCLMDVKLGLAFHEKIVPQHIKMSSDAAKEFLAQFALDEKTVETIIECVEGHHGKDAFDTLEAEITANADCYRFISPKGIFFFFTVLGRRLGDDLTSIIDGVESKMDEKMNIVSLPLVKDELQPVYKNMKEYFKLSR